ncbi:prolipoprotein diacylglyceryl transferase [Nonomuraea africana]|uniref:Uncharacterized protein n=1 Tax=Nonomuraea africana TaxID=46171 RepID=A0ABR9KK68_9ACTN|nr:hypothetical protein [Nonomuraea africana]MBE1562418.1 hypothetical protein [Nonomuraea africana]
MHGHVPSPTGQPDEDRLEILSGPGHDQRPQKSRKPLVIAASALAALLVAGGVGVTLLGDDAAPGGSTSQTGEQAQRPGAESESETGAEDDSGPGEDLGDSGESAEGDALPVESGESAEGDALPADPPADDSDTGSAGQATGGNGASSKDTSKGTSKDTSKGSESGTGQQESSGPADGPAGEVAGQCAADGC